MGFYDDMAAMARDLLAPTSQNGLGQGVITLNRVSGSAPGANPWDPSTPVTTSETIRGAAKGISKQLIGTEAGGTVLLATDLEVISEVPKMGYQPGDTLSIDGRPLIILHYSNIPAAGVAAAVRFIVRG